MGWGVDTSYGAYHFASRVLPLWLISLVDWVVVLRKDKLPVLNQDERENHSWKIDQGRLRRGREGGTRLMLKRSAIRRQGLTDSEEGNHVETGFDRLASRAQSTKRFRHQRKNYTLRHLLLRYFVCIPPTPPATRRSPPASSPLA